MVCSDWMSYTKENCFSFLSRKHKHFMVVFFRICWLKFTYYYLGWIFLSHQIIRCNIVSIVYISIIMLIIICCFVDSQWSWAVVFWINEWNRFDRNTSHPHGWSWYRSVIKRVLISLPMPCKCSFYFLSFPFPFLYLTIQFLIFFLFLPISKLCRGAF